MKLPKIKITNGLDDASLERIKKINIDKCRAVCQAKPFATAVYIAMKTGLTIEFIRNNFNQIKK